MSTMIRRTCCGYLTQIVQGRHASSHIRCFATWKDKGSKYTSSSDDEHEGPLPDPPNPMLAIGAMGIGAFFAVGIAAVGVYSAFYMAAWTVANSTIFPKSEKKTKNGVDEAEKEINAFLREKFGWESDDKNK